MKNIHILPTNKPSTPSRLFYKDQELVFSKKYSVFNGVNIYITSDEKFVRDEYITDGIEVIKATPKLVNAQGLVNRRNWRKVILTTDQELINDGVQAIPDEFLEWFVKNPSCEEVEVESKVTKDGVWTDLKGYVELPTIHSISYKITIPKEIDVLELGQIIPKEEPKQETLEEATKNFLNTKQEFYFKKDSLLWKFLIKISQFGAKWQQEQDKNKYSDKEVKHLMTLAFEQGFKKADVVEAGLEAKETDTEVNWIFLKHKK